MVVTMRIVTIIMQVNKSDARAAPDRHAGRALTTGFFSVNDTIAAAIHRFLETERPRQTAFLADLVRTPSDNPPGDCAPHAEHAAALLEALGFTVERHPVPPDLVRAHGMVSATNLVVRHRFGPGGEVIALNAHGDVVPPGEGWTHDPYGAEIVDGWMYGRGVAVSKSDFATYAFALLALPGGRSPGARRGRAAPHLRRGIRRRDRAGWLLAQGISRPDFVIGAGFSYAVVDAHNGCLHLEVEVRGRSAHAARPYGRRCAAGGDACCLRSMPGAAVLLPASRRSPGIGAPQLTVGLIDGGINTNVVPDRVMFRLDRRIMPEENAAEVEAELRARDRRRRARHFPRPRSRSAASCWPRR